MSHYLEVEMVAEDELDAFPRLHSRVAGDHFIMAIQLEKLEKVAERQ
jgi:hypothetical protein